jgi:ketosteroid isomerase-like protein
MKRFLVIVAVLIAALVGPYLMLGQTGDTKAEQQVRALRNTLNQALLKGDVATLDKVFADEFTIIRPNGMAVGKAEAIKDVASGKTKFDSIEELDSKFRGYGKTAVMITVEKMTGQVGGNPFSNQLRNTYVFVDRDGQWVVVLRQMTPILAPKTDASSAK